MRYHPAAQRGGFTILSLVFHKSLGAKHLCTRRKTAGHVGVVVMDEDSDGPD